MIVNENNYVHLSNGVKILTIEQLHKLYPKLTPAGFNYKSNGKWVYDLDDDRIIKRPIDLVINFYCHSRLPHSHA
jgi:hypothetical protein